MAISFPVMAEHIMRECRSVERRHCPHCGKYLSFKTYKVHKRLYYDPNASTWEGELTKESPTIIPSQDESSPPQSEEEFPLPEQEMSPPPCLGKFCEYIIDFLQSIITLTLIEDGANLAKNRTFYQLLYIFVLD